jgi:hypothetical protein
MRLLCVGDIHTKIWIIEEIGKIVENYDHVVFCGDYADNWNTGPAQTIETWRALKSLMDNNPNVGAVIGNHDYAYIHAEIAGRSSGWNQVTFTLLNAPENKDLKDWLLSLPVVFELEGVTFSHAGVTEGWNGSLNVYDVWNDTSPIWARPQAWGGLSRYKEIPQVIGHNPGETIWNPQKGVWCVDTFSETPDNEPIGDHTVLEINNNEYKKIKIKNNHSSPGI